MELPAGTLKARFERAYNEFGNLEGVDNDPARTNTVADLVYITQFEIDLAESGESEIDVSQHRKFVKKWGGEMPSESLENRPQKVSKLPGMVPCLRFVGVGKNVMQGQECKAVACSKNMAKRIANALNVYQPSREGC